MRVVITAARGETFACAHSLDLNKILVVASPHLKYNGKRVAHAGEGANTIV